MKVHYGGDGFEKVAPCGYKFRKAMQSLDRARHWEGPYPPNCFDCLMEKPTMHKGQQSVCQAVAEKPKTRL